jgi:CheY-like chemotaxis protein
MKTHRASSKPARVLVVEDNPDIRELLIELLASEGNEVRGATDGAGGIAMAQEWGPDVVLLDVSMPTLNGREVARELRSDPRTAHIPLVTLGAAEPMLAQNSRRGGSDDSGGRDGGDDDGDDGGGAAGAVASLTIRSGRAVAAG